MVAKIGKKVLKCKYCGSSRLAKDGFVWGPHGKTQRYLCGKCKVHQLRPHGAGVKAMKRMAGGS